MKHLKTFKEQADWATSNKIEDTAKEDITKPNCRNCGAAFKANKKSCPFCGSAYKEKESETQYRKSAVKAHK